MQVPQPVRNARDAAKLTRAALMEVQADSELETVLKAIEAEAVAGHHTLTDWPIPARTRVRLVAELHALRFEAWASLPSPESSKARLNVNWPDHPEALGG